MVHNRQVTVARARSLDFQVAGEAFDADAADPEQRQGTGTAPGGELTQIQHVSLSCQAAVPGQREPSGITECWLEGDEGGCGGGHRVPPGPGSDR
jgi:hypothetical protein